MVGVLLGVFHATSRAVTCLQHQECFVILSGNCKIIQLRSANKFIVASSWFEYYTSRWQVTLLTAHAFCIGSCGLSVLNCLKLNEGIEYGPSCCNVESFTKNGEDNESIQINILQLSLELGAMCHT